MRKTVISIFSTFFCSFACISIVRADATFVRNLSVGDRGPDVKELQVILNRDPLTALSGTGLGSLGMETSYFGPKTAEAVVKFQEKYAEDILLPNGLASGNGFVGQKTREKLESLIGTGAEASSTPISNSPNATAASSSVSDINSSKAFSDALVQYYISRGVIPQSAAFNRVFPNDLMIFGLSHAKAKPGDLLQVTGVGFGSDMLFHIGSSETVSIQATTSDLFSVIVPGISYGKYRVWLTDAGRTTENETPFFLNIGNLTDARPQIMSVSPTQAYRDSEIVVTADALDTTNNTIYSNLGIIRSVPSVNGRSLVFKTADLPNTAAFFSDQNTDQFTVTFSVGTPNGQSINYGYFHLSK